MKKLVQLILLVVLLTLLILFYKNYFFNAELKNKETQQQINLNESIKKNTNDLNKISKSNLIKNLKYEITVNEDNLYKLDSELSKITYDQNDQELILMSGVKALIGNINYQILISSDEARYNNFDHRTNFTKNVKIEFDKNIILADEIFLDFKNNSFLINDNIKYSGPMGTIDADTMKLDLITKKIDIFMKNTNDHILVKFKNK